MENLYGALIVVAAILTIASESNNNLEEENTTKHVKAVQVSIPDINENSSTSVSVHSSTTENSDMPEWKKNLQDGAYYGWAAYLSSREYKINPNKKPTICINDYMMDDNGTVWGNFVCPMYGHGQAENLDDCCEPVTSRRQVCCDKEAIMDDFEETRMDIMTAIGIITAFIVFIGCCLLLYHCCGQRRPSLKGKILWSNTSPTKKENLDLVQSGSHMMSMSDADAELTIDHMQELPIIVIRMANGETAQHSNDNTPEDKPSTSCAVATNEHVTFQQARNGSTADDTTEEAPLLLAETRTSDAS